jgi:hypothetical protein
MPCPHPLVLYVAIVRQVHERHTMRVHTTTTFASAITMTVVAALMATSAAAQTAPQTIVVDGVKYQALPSTASGPAPSPYAFPVASAPYNSAPVAAPIAVTRVGYPLQTSQPVTVAEPSGYEAQSLHPTANVVVPIIATAIGVWALSQWFKPERGYGRAHDHGHGHGNGQGHRQVVVQRPVQPVWVPPAHGGHHPR